MPSAPSVYGNMAGTGVEPPKKKTRVSAGVRQRLEEELNAEVADSCGLSIDVLSAEELRMHGIMSDKEVEAYLQVGASEGQ